MGRKSETPVEKRVENVLALLRKEAPASQIARRAGQRADSRLYDLRKIGGANLWHRDQP